MSALTNTFPNVDSTDNSVLNFKIAQEAAYTKRVNELLNLDVKSIEYIKTEKSESFNTNSEKKYYRVVFSDGNKAIAVKNIVEVAVPAVGCPEWLVSYEFHEGHGVNEYFKKAREDDEGTARSLLRAML